MPTTTRPEPVHKRKPASLAAIDQDQKKELTSAALRRYTSLRQNQPGVVLLLLFLWIKMTVTYLANEDCIK